MMTLCGFSRRAIGTIAALSLFPAAVGQQLSNREAGTVHLPVGCEADAAAYLERGLTQLHHMMYGNAREWFRQAESADPGCAMALWGVGMTYIHPLWGDRPSPEELSLGAALMSQAVAIGGHDAREDSYIATTRAYFQGGAGQSESERLIRFEEAWRAAHETNPDDPEAKAFYALSQLATVDPTDKSYRKQQAAGRLAEEVLTLIPDHPGAHHYIIHAYDLPALAERALPITRDYGAIAPEVPHALHMTSHIFTRLGLWDEAIEWNRRAADAAWQLSEEAEAISIHYLHAMDYLAYAHLQKGEDLQAREIAEELASLQGPFDAVNRDAQAYAFAAVPARHAMERGDWAAAAILEPRTPDTFPWNESHAAYVAITHFSRGLGLAHRGEVQAAEAELAVLTRIRDQTALSSTYWASQVEIQRLALQAWITYLGGDTETGLARMRQAAEQEAATEKSPTTPGEVVPASELLGDMLAASGQHAEAAAAYEAALQRSPLRLNSLYGAGRAFERSGNTTAADAHYERIATITGADSTRPAVESMRGR